MSNSGNTPPTKPSSPSKKPPLLKQLFGTPLQTSGTNVQPGFTMAGVIPTLALSGGNVSKLPPANPQRTTLPNPASTFASNPATSRQPNLSGSAPTSVLGNAKILATERSRADGLSDVVLVSRNDRVQLMTRPKDWNDYLKHMITPSLTKKLDVIDMAGLTDCSSIVSNSASVSELLNEVEKHMTRYNLVHLFTEFPVLDASKYPNDPRRWWDDRRTIDLFLETDWIDKETVAQTVAWMRRHLDDDQVTHELNWTADYLLECCEDAIGGAGCFKSVVSGEIHQFQSQDPFQYGGPLTLMIILTHLWSSSERAILRLGAVVKELKISQQRGENINVICNQLMYVLQRLERTQLPADLIPDLFNMFQTSSNAEFNAVFKSWKHLHTLKLCKAPTWVEILDKARICYDSMIEDWTLPPPAPAHEGVGGFTAATSVPPRGSERTCHNCGEVGHLQADCPHVKAGSTWYTDPPAMRPNSKKGDRFTVASDGRKNWSKQLKMPDGSTQTAKWCGRCQNPKWKRKGTWTTGPASHFTSTCPHRPAVPPSANLAASSGDAGPSSESGGDSSGKRTFSQALQGFQAAASDGAASGGQA